MIINVILQEYWEVYQKKIATTLFSAIHIITSSLNNTKSINVWQKIVRIDYIYKNSTSEENYFLITLRSSKFLEDYLEVVKKREKNRTNFLTF